MGGLFIAVVMYFPNGLAGLWESHGRQALAKLLRRKPVVRAPVKAEAKANTKILETQP